MDIKVEGCGPVRGDKKNQQPGSMYMYGRGVELTSDIDFPFFLCLVFPALLFCLRLVGDDECVL